MGKLGWGAISLVFLIGLGYTIFAFSSLPIIVSDWRNGVLFIFAGISIVWIFTKLDAFAWGHRD